MSENCFNGLHFQICRYEEKEKAIRGEEMLWLLIRLGLGEGS